jgi:hypothetical protein
MTITETDIFVQAGNTASTDIPDGLAVSDVDGKEVHFLNPVASAVFLLCDGAHDARAIAAILAEEYGLAEPPLQDVINCLGELQSFGIIRKS